MNKTQMAKVIKRAWLHLEVATQNDRRLSEIVETAYRQTHSDEKHHRLLAPPHIRTPYNLNASVTAKYWVLRHILTAPKAQKVHWIQVTQLRQDIVLCYSLAHRLKELDRFKKAFPSREILKIDYVKHISNSSKDPDND